MFLWECICWLVGQIAGLSINGWMDFKKHGGMTGIKLRRNLFILI